MKASTFLFLGVGTRLTKEFLVHFVNEHTTIKTVITIVSWDKESINFNREVELIELNFLEVNRGYYPSDIIDIYPADENLIKIFNNKMFEIFKIMDRADIYSFYSFESRARLFLKHIEFWNSLIISKKIDLVVSTDMPHECQDYIAYYLCEHYKINRCFLVQTQIHQFYQIFDNLDSNLEILAKYREVNSINDKITNPIMAKYYEDQLDVSYKPFYMNKNRISLFQKFCLVFCSLFKMFKYFINNKLFKFKNLIDFLFKRYNYGSAANAELEKYYDENSIVPDFSTNYLYLPLHFQPERTTSPQGGIFSYQEIYIKMVSYHAPKNWLIYIKEHPSQNINGRSIAFYKTLNELPNVKFVKKDSDSIKLLLNSKAVITVTGTAAWEALFFKKPTIIFGNIYFKYVYGSIVVKNNSDLIKAFDIIVNNNIKFTDENIVQFLNWCDKFFFHGAIDEVYYPNAEIEWETNLSGLIKNISTFLTNNDK